MNDAASVPPMTMKKLPRSMVIIPEKTPRKTDIFTAAVTKKTRKYVPIISAKYGL